MDWTGLQLDVLDKGGTDFVPLSSTQRNESIHKGERVVSVKTLYMD